MAAPISGAKLTEFNGLASFEHQVAWLLAELAAAESVYNGTATTTVNNVTFSPDYDTNQLSVTVTLNMERDAAIKTPAEAVLPYLP